MKIDTAADKGEDGGSSTPTDQASDGEAHVLNRGTTLTLST